MKILSAPGRRPLRRLLYQPQASSDGGSNPPAIAVKRPPSEWAIFWGGRTKHQEKTMLMSKAAYAKHRGVSRQTVYDWIARGDVVMSGTKIDVEATERQRQGGDDPGSEVTTTDLRESRTFEMTFGEFWIAVQTGDNKTPPPATDEEIQQCVRLAAGELNWSVEFLEDDGIYLDDGDSEHYVVRYDLKTNAGVAIGLIRQELCHSASLCPDDMDEWSQEGLKALSEWAKG